MSEKKSRLAIIIPCFNEELVVKTTVETLLRVLDGIIQKGKITEDSYIYLDDFSVTAACRGKGIGTKLIGMAEGYAASLGVSAIVLHVEEANEGAHRLDSSLGYSDHEDQGNRILMVKELRK